MSAIIIAHLKARHTGQRFHQGPSGIKESLAFTYSVDLRLVSGDESGTAYTPDRQSPGDADLMWCERSLIL